MSVDGGHSLPDDLFRATCRLERRGGGARRVGREDSPKAEPVRFRQHPHLHHAARDVVSQQVPDSPHVPATLECYWPSLIGPNGPLPHFVTEQAIWERLSGGAQPLCDLLDMIGGRFIALFYRAWTVGMPAYCLNETDAASDYLRAMKALHGPAPAAVHSHQRTHVSRFLGYPRSRDMLLGLLKETFGLDVRIEQFVGTWLAIPCDARPRLGESAARIGHGFVIGTRTWDRRCRMRIHLRGGTFGTFLGFLPGKPLRQQLDALLRSFLRPHMEWDVEYELPAGEVPPARFGAALRLGFSTWLGRPHAPVARVRLPKTRYHLAASSAHS